jgi:hypothetical protein
LLISLTACVGARSIEGKWEADIAMKSSGPGAKVVFEFLPDGTRRHGKSSRFHLHHSVAMLDFIRMFDH